MDQYQSHIIEQLLPFIDKKDQQFDMIFERMISPNKEMFKGLLVYIHRLLDTSIHDDLDLRYLHLHFPYFEHTHNVFLEFICIKFFLLNIGQQQEDNGEATTYLNELITRIDRIISRDIQLETAKKKELEQKTQYRSQLKALKRKLGELQGLGIDASKPNYMPVSMINVLVKDRNDLLDTCAPTPYFMSLDDLSTGDPLRPMSYVLLNERLDRDGIDGLPADEDQDMLANIKHIILFNSDGRSTNRQFNYSDINTLNIGEGLNVKNLIVISFDQRPFKLNGLISQLSSITTRYFERSQELDTRAYTIMPFEVDHLLGIERPPDMHIEFIGKDNLIWQNFQERIHEYEDLQELISIKMRNIYSLCNNDVYKGIVLKDIFSFSTSPEILSLETKERVLRLGDDERGELRSLLFSVLSMVQMHGPLNRVEESLGSGKYCIILPPAILKVRRLMDQVQGKFRRATKVDLVQWKELRPDYPGNVIVLDYRDPGRYPYLIYPSIFEHTLEKARSINAFFVSMFFRYNYEYISYGYNRALYSKVLAHPVRRSCFKWGDLVSNIRYSKPDPSLSYLWDLDNNYTSHNDRDPVVIALSTGSKKSYPASELFVAKYEEDERLISIKAEDIVHDLGNRTIFVQPLDELYKGGNLFEATMEEEAEIEQLKKEFDLNDQDPEIGLWKVLLKRKAEELGTAEVYHELQASTLRLGLPFIKDTYFIGHWLDPQSDLLIPRSKRVFRSVCVYLNLPDVYFRVMLKKRAKERLASRRSNAQMDRLIAALVDMGMFDAVQPAPVFDEAFIAKYELEDIGFDIATIHNDLYALVELCKAHLDPKQVITAELKRS